MVLEFSGLFLQGLSLNVQNIFTQWEAFGVYDFILPFLLLFSVLFGVLGFIGTFQEHKGLNVIISLALSLMAVRFPFFTDFVNLIAPQLGVGIMVLLALLILIGMFIPGNYRQIISWIMLAVGVIIGLVILGNMYSDFGYSSGYFGEEIVSWLLLLGLLIGVIVAVVVNQSSGSPDQSAGPAGLYRQGSNRGP